MAAAAPAIKSTFVQEKKERRPCWYPDGSNNGTGAYVTCHFNFKRDGERGGHAIVIIDLDQIHNLGQTHCLFEQDGNSVIKEEGMVLGGQLVVSTTQIDLPPPGQASACSLIPTEYPCVPSGHHLLPQLKPGQLWQTSLWGSQQVKSMLSTSFHATLC